MLMMPLVAVSQNVRQHLLTNQVDGKIIYAWHYDIGHDTEGMDLSSDGNRVFVRHSSKMLSYSLVEKKVLWERNSGAGQLVSMRCLADGTLATYLKENILTKKQWANTELKDDAGNIKWKKRFIPLVINDTLGVMMGFGNDEKKGLETAQFGVLRISDGSWIWTDQLDHSRPTKMGASQRLSNGKYIVYHDELSLVDINHGVERHLPFASDTVAAISKNGHYINSSKSKLYNLRSALTHIGDSIILIADRQRLYCFTPDLAVLWEASLPTNMTSCSTIAVSNDKVFLFNHGTAVKASDIQYPTATQWGAPYLARFDLKTGRLEDLTEIDVPTPVLEVATNGKGFLTYSQNTTLHVIKLQDHPTATKLKGKAIKKIMGVFEPRAYRLEGDSVVNEDNLMYAYRRAGFAYGILSYDKLISVNSQLEAEDADYPLTRNNTDKNIYTQLPSEKDKPTIFVITDDNDKVIMRLEVPKGILLTRKNGRIVILTEKGFMWADDPTFVQHQLPLNG